MTAFTPSSFHAVAVLAAALGSILALGLVIVRIPSRPARRAAAWALAAGAVVLADRATSEQPAGVRMLAVIALLLTAMKAVVGVEATTRLSYRQWLAFAALWPGMRPAIFRTLPSAPRPGAARLAALGLLHVATGAALIALSRAAWSATGSTLATAALVLPGLSLVLHFGLFNLAASAWRVAGVDANPLFRAPLLSTSLAEFWGRRWNIAFAELSATGVYRPIAAIAGRGSGIAAAFIVSGLLHELAISLPVRAGYGLPFLYFVIHGAGTLAERWLPLDRHRWFGRAWTIAWLVLPLPILFHAPFLRGVVWPLVGLEA
jgi:alginate O-acetyltransferase complex protein AlgI